MPDKDEYRKSIRELLSMGLDIPPYQRPYKWDNNNILDLLNDIGTAIKDKETHNDPEFRYRIGTIILHKNENGSLDIVDGQQRIISLVLLLKYLEQKFECTILKKSFPNTITQANIQNNYRFIAEWFSLNTKAKDKYLKAINELLEVIVLSVNNVTEAFQLFDSQNTRGKELDPHDLLKAYHLREMKDYRYEMEHAVTKWEAKETAGIRILFKDYLYPILNWSQWTKSKSFTTKDIDIYKGITEDSDYTYARRAGKAMPYFQITEPFLAGNDFFEMVDHYLTLLNDVQREVENESKDSKFKELKTILDAGNGNVGFSYARNLFYCALLCYYDRFYNFDELAVKKLFTWAFMLRVDMRSLGYDSVNKYAVGGEGNDNYTNHIPMFAEISRARLHTAIASINIETNRSSNRNINKKWDWLYAELQKLNGRTEVSE